MDIWRNLRYAFRSVVAERRLTAAAVLTLGLGIGANAAVFSAVDALLLKPLPVAHPEELAAVFTSDSSGVLYGTSSFLDYRDFADNATFSTVFAFRSALPMTMRADARLERRRVSAVSGNYFDALGIRPAIGRFLGPQDDAPGAERRLVLSHVAWQQLYARSPSAIGRILVLNDRPFVVIGVAPPGFTGLRTDQIPDAWIPMTATATNQTFFTNRRSRGLWVIGRRRPGVTLKQAQAALTVTASRLYRQYPTDWSDRAGRPRTVTVLREQDTRYRNALGEEGRVTMMGMATLLFAIAAVLLLVACANVASLLLARASAARREVGVRLALGASRRTIGAQWLTESLILAALGGTAGLALAASVLGAIQRAATGLPNIPSLDLTIDGRVTAYIAGVALIVTLLFGVGPALNAARTSPMNAWRPELNSRWAQRWHNGRGLLVAFQLSASLALLAMGGTLLRTLLASVTTPPGFATSGVALLSVQLPSQLSAAAGLNLQDRILEAVEALPDVEQATFAQFVPLSRDVVSTTVLVGPGTTSDEEVDAFVNRVGPKYFETLGIPINSGRPLRSSDTTDGAPPVVVVSDRFARRYWRGGHALGQRLRTGGPNAPLAEVVGVAADVRIATVSGPPDLAVYAPIRFGAAPGTLHVRAAGKAATVIPSVRATIAGVNPDVVLFDVKTIDQHLSTARAPLTLASSVVGLFAIIAVGLAMSGLYSVVAFAVARRTREIGIRISLGATRLAVARLIATEGTRLVGVGLLVGSAFAVPATHALQAVVSGLDESGWSVLFSSMVLLVATAAASILVSVRRAVRIEPAVALRLD